MEKHNTAHATVKLRGLLALAGCRVVLPARRALYVFSAKGTISFLAWDIVPGTDRAVNKR
jgi:hypothetical protein